MWVPPHVCISIYPASHCVPPSPCPSPHSTRHITDGGPTRSMECPTGCHQILTLWLSGQSGWCSLLFDCLKLVYSIHPLKVVKRLTYCNGWLNKLLLDYIRFCSLSLVRSFGFYSVIVYISCICCDAFVRTADTLTLYLYKSDAILESKLDYAICKYGAYNYNEFIQLQILTK